MYLVSENYKKAHNLSTEQFLDMNRQFAILNYISECPDIFDAMITNVVSADTSENVTSLFFVWISSFPVLDLVLSLCAYKSGTGSARSGYMLRS